MENIFIFFKFKGEFRDLANKKGGGEDERINLEY
jgi:hypothetical protein